MTNKKNIMKKDNRSEKRKKVDSLFWNIVHHGGENHIVILNIVKLLVMICDEIFGPGDVVVEDE